MAAVKLPRYVMFKGDNGLNLCLNYINDERCYLCFNSTNRDLWGTHEVIPVPDQQDVVQIKSMYNGKWWILSDNDWIFAKQSEKPDDSKKDCLFKVVQLSGKKVALQSVKNNRYVKRYTTGNKISALNALANTTDEVFAQLEVSEAEAPFKLPRNVMFKGDNGLNLCLYSMGNEPYLCFNSTNRDSWGEHEVIYVPDQQDVVKIKSVHNGKWWILSNNDWILAKQSEEPDDSKKDGLFKVVQLSGNKVALQCTKNNKYVKRFTTGDKTSALNARAPDTTNDATVQMEVSEPEAPFKLPRYVMFRGDNGNNLCLNSMDDEPYLCFSSTNQDLSGVHEVTPVPDQQNVVKIRSIQNGNWWILSDKDWILAKQSEEPDDSKNDCLFKVVQLIGNRVALQCVGNNKYVKRSTTGDKTSAVNACAPNTTDDVTVQMDVSEVVPQA